MVAGDFSSRIWLATRESPPISQIDRVLHPADVDRECRGSDLQLQPETGPAVCTLWTSVVCYRREDLRIVVNEVFTLARNRHEG